MKDLEFYLKATGGKTLNVVAKNFSALGTDSRADLSGKMFVALRGENFDAHDFLDGAVLRGAAGLIVDRPVPAAVLSKVTVIQVPDTLKALQQLGTSARRQSRARIVALTGSNGKTTTKEFISALIAPSLKVHASKGSFNNHWGVPLTLFEIPADAEIAVIEMGMNHSGEISELVRIAEPDVVMCTMVGRAHIEFFGTIEKIAEAKEEIYEAASARAVRIYNVDDAQTATMFLKAPKRFPDSPVLTFSASAPADVRLRIVRLGLKDLEIDGEIRGVAGRVTIPVFGAQNLTNLMAAAAAGLAVGLTPAQVWLGLGKCRTIWGRNQLVQLQSGAEMIFDAYNANPDSMRALLENVRRVEVRGRKVAVFGQMRELGDHSAELHEELGRLAAGAGFAQIFFVGADQASFQQGLKSGGFSGHALTGADYNDSLGSDLARGLEKGDLVVVKGSRGTKLERFVEPCRPLDFGSKD